MELYTAGKAKVTNNKDLLIALPKYFYEMLSAKAEMDLYCHLFNEVDAKVKSKEHNNKYRFDPKDCGNRSDVYQLIFTRIQKQKEFKYWLHINVKIANIPNATAVIVDFLSNNKFNIKSIKGIDALIKDMGFLELVVTYEKNSRWEELLNPDDLSQEDIEKNLKMLDDEFKKIIPPQYLSASRDEKIVNASLFFPKHYYIAGAYNSDEGLLLSKDIDRKIIDTFKINTEEIVPLVIDKEITKELLNGLMLRNGSDVDSYFVGIIIDTSKEFLKVLIKDPNEIILPLQLTLKDNVGQLTPILKNLGENNVNLRIVQPNILKGNDYKVTIVGNIVNSVYKYLSIQTILELLKAEIIINKGYNEESFKVGINESLSYLASRDINQVFNLMCVYIFDVKRGDWLLEKKLEIDESTIKHHLKRNEHIKELIAEPLKRFITSIIYDLKEAYKDEGLKTIQTSDDKFKHFYFLELIEFLGIKGKKEIKDLFSSIKISSIPNGIFENIYFCDDEQIAVEYSGMKLFFNFNENIALACSFTGNAPEGFSKALNEFFNTVNKCHYTIKPSSRSTSDVKNELKNKMLVEYYKLVIRFSKLLSFEETIREHLLSKVEAKSISAYIKEGETSIEPSLFNILGEIEVCLQKENGSKSLSFNKIMEFSIIKFYLQSLIYSKNIDEKNIRLKFSDVTKKYTDAKTYPNFSEDINTYIMGIKNIINCSDDIVLELQNVICDKEKHETETHKIERPTPPHLGERY
jgi:hypothetical protein